LNVKPKLPEPPLPIPLEEVTPKLPEPPTPVPLPVAPFAPAPPVPAPIEPVPPRGPDPPVPILEQPEIHTAPPFPEPPVAVPLEKPKFPEPPVPAPVEVPPLPEPPVLPTPGEPPAYTLCCIGTALMTVIRTKARSIVIVIDLYTIVQKATITFLINDSMIYSNYCFYD
jgi:hypothetical protein